MSAATPKKPRGNPARVAFGTLTAIPAGADWDAESAKRAVGWYPAVGWVVGSLGAAVPLVAALVGWRGKSAAIVGVLILGVIAAASKAMHYDALADVADGLLGGHSAQGKLEIMEDSAIGAFGATAVAFSVVAQGAALTGVVQNTAWYAIIVGCVVARASASVALWTLPAAREIGLVAPLVGRPRAGTVLVALLGVLALGALGFVVVGNDFSSIALTRVPFAAWPAHQIRGFVACLVGALAAGFILPRLLARPIKGITGDVVGASILITTGFCFAVAALFG